MAKIRCYICGRPFDTEQSKSMPFCSERCRTVDLGRWLGEAYGVPHEPEEPDAEEPREPED